MTYLYFLLASFALAVLVGKCIKFGMGPDQ